MKLSVQLKDNHYNIYIKKGLLDDVCDYIKPIMKGKKIMIISDDHVFPLYGHYIESQLSSFYDVSHIIVNHGEQSKSIDILPSLYKQLLSFKMSRTDMIIALGGGVIGDLAGFIASTYLRGIDFVQIPTSLLAQVDSSVGGKVGIDLEEGKNLVGAFKHPLLVLIDPHTLKTLDNHYINDGMGEVIKYACLFDKSLFHELKTYPNFNALYKNIESIIYQCVQYKKQIVEEDVYDKGRRMLLNFGHTLAHALEQYYQYQHYSHGEAVSIGMVQITKISEQLGLTSKGVSDCIQQLCLHYHLPIQANVPINKLIDTIQLDKKNMNHFISFIMIKDIGDPFIYKHDISLLDNVKEI